MSSFVGLSLLRLSSMGERVKKRVCTDSLCLHTLARSVAEINHRNLSHATNKSPLILDTIQSNFFSIPKFQRRGASERCTFSYRAKMAARKFMGHLPNSYPCHA